MHPWFKKPNRKQEAEQGIQRILGKLKAGKYNGAAMEEADRKMLEIYLKRVA